MHIVSRPPSRQTTSPPRPLRPRAGFERRERAFGVGYGNSSGYASERRYTPETGPRAFRIS